MKVSYPTACVLLDTRRKKDDGSFPVKLRVTFNKVQKYYPLGLSLTETAWEEISDESKRSKEIRELRIKKNFFQSRADNIIKDMKGFAFETFEKKFFEKQIESQEALSREEEVTYLFTDYIKALEKEKRYSTATAYQTAINSLLAYRKKIKFTDITPEFLAGYENKMIADGNSYTTIGIYLRSLRTILNQALAKELITKKQYPFGKHLYQIPGTRNVKKALTLSDVEKIYKYEAPALSPEDKARDFWMLSYLCNGANMKDICRLKNKDVDKETIRFVRAKTARTTRQNQRTVVVTLSDPIREIISKWGNPDKRPEAYLFPILSDGVTAKRERELVQYLTKYVNKYMKRVAEKTGINKPVNTYSARHSFATILKRSGAPMEFISESLGHQDLKTTESYLDSFEDDVKKQYSRALLNFSSQS